MGDRNSRYRGKRTANALGLRDSQAAWWQQWRGAMPSVVTTTEEALDAIAPGWRHT